MGGVKHSGEIFGVGYCCPGELHLPQHTSSRRGQPRQAFLPELTTDPPFFSYINTSVNWSTKKTFYLNSLTQQTAVEKNSGKPLNRRPIFTPPLMAGSKNLFTFNGDGYELPL